MVHEGDRDGAVAFLEDINQKWANKILVPTYIDQGETALAQNRLDMIPQLSTADQQFHTVWQAVIDGMESGSGKNNASEAALRYMVEDRVKTAVHTYAESILAQYYGDTYTRSAVGWEKTGTDVMGLDSPLSIVPNPATHQVQIKSEVLIENEVLGIYDASGKLVMTREWIRGYALSIDVRALESGVYFCRLKDQRISEKLVIIK